MAEAENDILTKVKAFAEEAHGDQKRKYKDERYIEHPVRVMETCREYTNDLCILAAALLHDVIEDTQVSKRKLDKFLAEVMDNSDAEKTVELVDELTDVFVKSDYPSLNRRSRRNREAERLSDTSPEAQTIKYADVIDNVSDISEDPDFALTYLRECKQLLIEMKNGNPILRQRAVQTVDDCLQSFWNKSNVKAL